MVLAVVVEQVAASAGSGLVAGDAGELVVDPGESAAVEDLLGAGDHHVGEHRFGFGDAAGCAVVVRGWGRAVQRLALRMILRRRVSLKRSFAIDPCRICRPPGVVAAQLSTETRTENKTP